MGSDDSEPIERWTAKRRAALVISLLKGDTTAAEAARKHGLTVGEIDDWRERFQQGAGDALRVRPKNEDALKDEQVKRLKQKVGELALDLPNAIAYRRVDRTVTLLRWVSHSPDTRSVALTRGTSV